MVLQSYLRFSLDNYRWIRDKKHTCWFSKEIYSFPWILPERSGIKIIWIGSPKLFAVIFGYSTDGSGIKIILIGYQELNYWFSAVLAENRFLVSSLISSFTDSWCFFCKILDFFWIFLPKKGDFNQREEGAIILSKEPLS